jgi:hypothetical protein
MAARSRHEMKNGVFWDAIPHGVTSQKTPFFIVTAVKISNLTRYEMFSNPTGGNDV